MELQKRKVEDTFLEKINLLIIGLRKVGNHIKEILQEIEPLLEERVKGFRVVLEEINQKIHYINLLLQEFCCLKRDIRCRISHLDTLNTDDMELGKLICDFREALGEFRPDILGQDYNRYLRILEPFGFLLFYNSLDCLVEGKCVNDARIE